MVSMGIKLQNCPVQNHIPLKLVVFIHAAMLQHTPKSHAALLLFLFSVQTEEIHTTQQRDRYQ